MPSKPQQSEEPKQPRAKLTEEERKERKREYQRRYYEANKEQESERNRRWYEANYEANKEQYQESSRRWYEANKEQELERMRRWREANKEQFLECQRRWREANKEQIKERHRRWREANKEQVLERNRRRRARKAGAIRPGFPKPTTASNRRLLTAFGNACAYCGSGGPFHIDHIEPLNAGGLHTPSNLAPACQRCNLSKQDKPVEAWYLSQPFFSPTRWKVLQAHTGRKWSPLEQLPLFAQ